MDAILQTLARELERSPEHVQNVATLIDEGATIPFIARYRKELHGSMDDQLLRRLADRLQYLRNLEARKGEVAAAIENQGKLTQELSDAIAAAATLAEVEDLYRPYKQKRRTRATIAREKGLEPLARLLSAQGPAVDPRQAALDFLGPDKGVETAEDALQGASDILAEEISDDADIRRELRQLYLRRGMLASRAAAKEPEDTVYRLYYDFKVPVGRAQGHQVLAVNRGEREGVLKVTVEQFYGIEYEDFPCQIAQVGMWLMDHQMNLRVADQFGLYYARLPLKQSATIVHGNALRLNWEDVVSAGELSYILGNPPFVGARIMSGEQKDDLLHVFEGTKNAGNLDYVCCWYKKAVDMMQQNKGITTALVSTNSISQGEQVAILWEPLFSKGIHINFAYRTFKWSNEARGKAAVHCVIIGFGMQERSEKYIFENDTRNNAGNINAYLVDAPNVFIESRKKPLCAVPEIGIGNKPIDGGYYLFTEEEKNEFIKKEPLSEKYFRKWLGSEEFINGKERYCLWLGDCEPAELKKMPECLKRVDEVRKYRLASVSAPTRKLANTPRRFHVENMPDTDYIVIPEVSSENRYYIPIGFLSPDILSSNLVKIIPNASLYHFGILTSAVHNGWMRAVAGRLKSDYRYSKDIVYNNFPWPDVNDTQKAKIKTLAQAILDARAIYPNSSLADLYDPLTMPPELLKAHRALDVEVMKLYGFPADMTEAEVVAKLLELYQQLPEKAKS